MKNKTKEGVKRQTTVYTGYRIQCKCDTECIGETSRPLGVWIKENKYNSGQGYSERSKLAAQMFEEGHQIDWNQTDILQFEAYAIYRKYKGAVHMLCMDNSISEYSVYI
jgi:hypothetical protein